MARSGSGVRVTADAARIKRVARALRQVDAALPGELRKQLREAAQPLVARAKARVKAIPARGSAHSGLRRRIARGVRSEVATSRNPRVAITVGMADPQEKNLPAFMDRNEGWRHPVFGNRKVWVHQGTGGSWFMDTMEAGIPGLEKRVTQVLDDAVAKIDRAGK